MATWKKVIVSGSAAELASLTATGNITASAFYGDGSNLTGVAATSLDIDAFGSDLTAITVSGTDKLALSDAGTEGRITVSQLATPLADGTYLEASGGRIRIATGAAGAGLTGGGASALAVGAGTHITVNANDIAVNTTTLLPALSGSILGTVSGDITITAGGVATIAANSVALGTDTTGNYAGAVTAGSGIFVAGSAGEGTTFSVSADSGSMASYFRQDAYAGVSGDITIASNGAATIAANSVALGTDTTGNYVGTITAGNYISTSGAATGEGVAHSLSVNTTTLIPAISGSIFGTVSGDISITDAGVATIAANSVALGTDTTGNYVATVANVTNGGLTVNNSGAESAAVTVGLNLNDLAAATVAVSADSIAFIDATDNSTKKESIADLVAGIAGTNITAASGQLSLADTISGNKTFSNNVTVTGDLTVNGTTTTVSTTNVTIEDRFIILNYGSGSIAPAGEGGIIVEGGTAGSGEAFFYDQTNARWGVASGVSNTATSVTQAAAVSLVYDGSTANATAAGFDDLGNMAIISGDIYIYS